MVYTWGDIYCKQLKSGDDFASLKPTYSIWLMGKKAIKDDANYVHVYKLRDETDKASIQGELDATRLERDAMATKRDALALGE